MMGFLKHFLASDLVKKIAAGMLRHALTVAGGALMTYGYGDANTEVAIMGMGMTLGGCAWSWWVKVGEAKALALLNNGGK
jgi:hypothetical protein